MRDLGIGAQQGLSGFRPNNPIFKVGKVISTHPEDHSVDVMLLDTTATMTVPVLSGWMGSNFGITCLTGPSYDKKQPAKKTYPEAGPETLHSPTITSDVGRDIYALIVQMEGNYLGTADSAVIGFFPAQVSEMLFARDPMKDAEEESQADERGLYDDLLLVRHPSDVQLTIDKGSKLSMQLPNGTRFTMGPDVGAVNLAKKDYDRRYEIRENKDKNASAYVVAVDADGTARADVLVSADGIVHAIVFDSDGNKKADLFMSSEGVWEGAVYGGGEQQTARVRMVEEGKAEVYAEKEVKAHNDPGCLVILKENGDTEMHAPANVKITAGANVEVQAGSEISLTAGSHLVGVAPRIDWN